MYKGIMSLRRTIINLAEEFANTVIDVIVEMPVYELAEFHNNRARVRPKRLPAPKEAPKLAARKMPARGPGGQFLPSARKNALRQLAPKPVATGNA